MRMSGLDNIIRRALFNDAIVYAAESAGTMIAAKNLTPYIRGNDRQVNATKELYGQDAPLEALGLIDSFPICHASRNDHMEKTDIYRRNIAEYGGKAIMLDDSDVIIVNGRKSEVLRG
jgi:peptidase E